MGSRSGSRSLWLLPCMALLLGAAVVLPAQEPILLQQSTPFYRLGGAWSFLTDEPGTATLADVQSRSFVPQVENEPSLGFGGATHWARFFAIAAEGGGGGLAGFRPLWPAQAFD